MKIIDIIFTDPEKSAIKVLFEGNLIEVHTWQPESENMIDLQDRDWETQIFS